MVNIDSFLSRFKPCKRKAYEAYFSKPPVGSAILNKVTDFKAVQALGGKTYLSPREVLELKQNNTLVYSLIQKGIITAFDFILYQNGVLFKVLFSFLQDNFTYSDNTPITKESIIMKASYCEVVNGINTPYNMSLDKAYKQKKGTAQELENNFAVKWQKIVCNSQLEEVALPVIGDVLTSFRAFIPSSAGTYFIVGQLQNGILNRNSLQFVDNYTFSYIYDCRSWAKYYVASNIQTQPKELFELYEYTRKKESFSATMEDFIKSKFIDSFLNRNNVVVDFSTEVLSSDILKLNIEFAYESLEMYGFIYKKGSSYGFILEPTFHYEKEFKGNITEHIKVLEKKGFCVFTSKEFEEFKELLTGFLCLSNYGVSSQFSVPYLTNNEYAAIKRYSGRDYIDINDYLRGEEVEDKFNNYIKALFIYDILERCQIYNNIYHFRGLTLEKSIVDNMKEGYILDNTNFISTSLTPLVAGSFANAIDSDEKSIILVFKNTKRQQGLYLNNLSVHRGSEFEVLFNLNYNFKFVKKLGDYCGYDVDSTPVWLVELVPDKDKKLTKYTYQKDAIEVLLYYIQQEKLLMKYFYIDSVKDFDEELPYVFVDLKSFDIEGLNIRITLQDGECTIEFSGKIEKVFKYKIREKGYEYGLTLILGVLREQKSLFSEISKSQLASFSERFMFNLSSLFAANNLIITNQNVNYDKVFDLEDSIFGDSLTLNIFDTAINLADGTTVNEKPKVEVVSSEFTVLTSDLEELVFDIKMSANKEKVSLRIEAVDKDLKKEFLVEIDKREELAERVYRAIVKKFNLDCTRRLKRIFSIVAGYEEKYIDFYKRDEEFVCYIGEQTFNIRIRGTLVVITLEDRQVSFSYYEDIYESSKKIFSIIH